MFREPSPLRKPKCLVFEVRWRRTQRTTVNACTGLTSHVAWFSLDDGLCRRPKALSSGGSMIGNALSRLGSFIEGSASWMSPSYAFLLGSLGGRYMDLIRICLVKLGYPSVCRGGSPIALALRARSEYQVIRQPQQVTRYSCVLCSLSTGVTWKCHHQV